MRRRSTLINGMAFAVVICGCGSPTSTNSESPPARTTSESPPARTTPRVSPAHSSPEEAIKRFIVDEMLVTSGQYPGVKFGEGEEFGEEIKWHEPKTLHADLYVRGKVQMYKRAGPFNKRVQFQEKMIPKETRVYRLVFTYKRPGIRKMDAIGWRVQNPRHASKYNCDAVFYVGNNNQVLWVSPADYWDHKQGEYKIIREKLETEPGINEIHRF